MNALDLPGKMMAVQLKERAMLYNCYMGFFEHGGLFVPTDDIFSIGDEVLLQVEITNHPKVFLRTTVAWINPARTSATRPKGVGLAFGTDEICVKTKQLIENELGTALHSERATFTL